MFIGTTFPDQRRKFKHISQTYAQHQVKSMQKAKEKQLKSTDEEGDSSLADPDDKGPGTEQKQDDEPILEDVGGIQFEVNQIITLNHFRSY